MAVQLRQRSEWINWLMSYTYIMYIFLHWREINESLGNDNMKGSEPKNCFATRRSQLVMMFPFNKWNFDSQYSNKIRGAGTQPSPKTLGLLRGNWVAWQLSDQSNLATSDIQASTCGVKKHWHTILCGMTWGGGRWSKVDDVWHPLWISAIDELMDIFSSYGLCSTKQLCEMTATHTPANTCKDVDRSALTWPNSLSIVTHSHFINSYNRLTQAF